MDKLILQNNLETYLHDALVELTDDVELKYEMEGNLTEINHEGYDGFIPFTNGGYDLTVPMILNYVVGSGKYPGNDDIKKKIDDVVEYSTQLALESFCEQHIEQLSKLFTVEQLEKPDFDIINYHHLYDIDQGQLAETLSEYESESLMEGSTFFLQYRVLYFTADNSRNVSGEDELYFLSGVNLDFEYGRDKGLETVYERNVKVSELTPELIDGIIKDMSHAV